MHDLDGPAPMVPTVAAGHECTVVRVGALPEQSAGIIISGLPAPAETYDRLRAAIINSGYRWPERDITLTVLPSVPTADAGIDAALAVALLAADGQVPATHVGEVVCLGELGLDGTVRPVTQVPARLAAAGQAGYRCAIAPVGTGRREHTVGAWAADTLAELVDRLAGTRPLRGEPSAAVPAGLDLAVLPAESTGPRRALEVAAAGDHHLLLVTGSHGDRLLLAQLLATLLPDLHPPAAKAVADLYRQAGHLPRLHPHRPPWRKLWHPLPLSGWLGRPGRPGQLSLAHHGVLALDEQPASQPGVADALCAVLDTGQVTVAAGTDQAVLPARLQLVLTAGNHPLDGGGGAGPPGDGVHRRRLFRLCDRIDIHMLVPPLQPGRDGRPGERTSVVAARIAEARQAAAGRWETPGGPTNRFADLPALRAHVARWSPQARRPLDHAAQVGLLSPRGVTHVARLALTIADLDGRDLPIVDHVREAIWLRTGHQGGGGRR